MTTKLRSEAKAAVDFNDARGPKGKVPQLSHDDNQLWSGLRPRSIEALRARLKPRPLQIINTLSTTSEWVANWVQGQTAWVVGGQALSAVARS
jgi:hypothetical protein